MRAPQKPRFGPVAIPIAISIARDEILLESAEIPLFVPPQLLTVPALDYSKRDGRSKICRRDSHRVEFNPWSNSITDPSKNSGRTGVGFALIAAIRLRSLKTMALRPGVHQCVLRWTRKRALKTEVSQHFLADQMRHRWAKT